MRRRDTGGAEEISGGRLLAGRNTKKTSSGRGTRSGSTAKRTSAAGRSKAAEERRKQSAFLRSEASCIFLFALAVLLFLSNFGLIGAVGGFFKKLQLGLFGVEGYLFPVLLVLSCFVTVRYADSGKMFLKLAAVWGAYISLAALIHLFFGEHIREKGALRQYYEAGKAGGLIGGGLSGKLNGALGPVGTFIILAVLFILAMVAITERSFVGAVRTGSGKAYRHAKQDIGNYREERLRMREERRRLLEERRAADIDLGATDLSKLPSPEDDAPAGQDVSAGPAMSADAAPEAAYAGGPAAVRTELSSGKAGTGASEEAAGAAAGTDAWADTAGESAAEKITESQAAGSSSPAAMAAGASASVTEAASAVPEPWDAGRRAGRSRDAGKKAQAGAGTGRGSGIPEIPVRPDFAGSILDGAAEEPSYERQDPYIDQAFESAMTILKNKAPAAGSTAVKTAAAAGSAMAAGTAAAAAAGSAMAAGTASSGTAAAAQSGNRTVSFEREDTYQPQSWGTPAGSSTDDWGTPAGNGSTDDWGTPAGSGSTDDWGTPAGSGSTDDWGAPADGGSDDWGTPAGNSSTDDWGTPAGTGSTDDWGTPAGTGSTDDWGTPAGSSTDDWGTPAESSSTDDWGAPAGSGSAAGPGPDEPAMYGEAYDPDERVIVTASGKVIRSEVQNVKLRMEERRAEAGADEVKAAARKAEEAWNTAASEAKPAAEVEEPKYQTPPIDLLEKGRINPNAESDEEYRETAQKLQQTLHSFGVDVTVSGFSRGPTVTRYELLPAQGVKVSRIVALQDDIKLSLAASDIRIEAPIPGKSAVGIEVPNRENNTVYLRDLLESPAYVNSKARIAFAVGKDLGGQTVVTDITKMPHLLIAGATGSGKSVCINTLIMSILFRYQPKDVKLLMIDPKVVELSVYNGIPHLMIPVVTDPKKASAALNWAVQEMNDRYKKFATTGVRDLRGYNQRIEDAKRSGTADPAELPEALPQIVIIIDELADLMMVAQNDVEESICRLAQLARAAGIYLVIATQRPSVNVITGLIKANIPSRIAFAVSSGVDSRTILDHVGAEKLLGKGDMLFSPQGAPQPMRVQGAFVSDNEVQEIVDFIKDEELPLAYSKETIEQIARSDAGPGGSSSGRDELFPQAGRFIIERKKASIGNLQRMFKIGFNRAARIMDQLNDAGVVGDEQGTKPREILMTAEQFEELLRESGM